MLGMTSPRLVWIPLIGLVLSTSVAAGASGEGADSASAGPGALLQLQEMVTERLVSDPSGAHALEPLENPYTAWPGDTLLISVRFTTGDTPAPPGALLVLTVPDGLRYVPGSATGPGTRVSVSRDGGQSFEPDRASAEAGTPGGVRLRWDFPQALDAGVSGYLRYRVLRAHPPAPPAQVQQGAPGADGAAALEPAGSADAGGDSAVVVTADNIEDARESPAAPAAAPAPVTAPGDRP